MEFVEYILLFLHCIFLIFYIFCLNTPMEKKGVPLYSEPPFMRDYTLYVDILLCRVRKIWLWVHRLCCQFAGRSQSSQILPNQFYIIAQNHHSIRRWIVWGADSVVVINQTTSLLFQLRQMWKAEASVTTDVPTSFSLILYPHAAISLLFHANLTTSSWRVIASLVLVTDTAATWVTMQTARTAGEHCSL